LTLIKSISGRRGTIGGIPEENLTPSDIVKFSSAFGEWISRNAGIKKIVIGRDARPSGEMVNALISNTLVAMGFEVIDVGLSTTPTVEIAVPMEQAGGGIIITASHNPMQWNALKLLNQHGEFLSGADGSEVLEIGEAANVDYAKIQKLGKIRYDDTYLDKHIAKILSLPLVDADAIKNADFNIAVDPVNSSGAIAVPLLLEALGVHNVTLINGEPSGHFAHNPEPIPENISQLCQEITNHTYDLGIVVDPDVDRLALVTESGEPFGEEYTLVAVADYVLQHTPSDTVTNLSSSQALSVVTAKADKICHGAPVGEVHVVKKMKEVGAIIGGEGNGGIIYPELHYGRDALVGIALFLTALAKSGKSMTQFRAGFPGYVISKNKIELTPDIDVDEVLEQIKEKYKSERVNTEDGIKIEFKEAHRSNLTEWIHLRKSNTEPIIRIYAESDSVATADHLANKIMMDIKELITARI
jgi:phosphomannomutase